MGTRIKLWNFFSSILFIVAFAASLGVFYFARSGQGYTDLIINLIFDVIAAIFVAVYFLGCAGPAARMAAALNRTRRDIASSEEDARTLWGRYGRDAALFHNRRLDERYGAYLRELRRLYKQNAITADCRLDDYIGEELIYSAVNKPFCDQLGGIMSGLGILFTFIGLVYGLRNFDATSVDLMQASTQALMAGIKIAFMTSIFGLIYSLLINIFYKRLVKSALEALYAFQDVYTERVRPSNEHGAENAMLRLQTEQNAALERFGASVGEQVSEAIITLMGPTVDKMHDAIAQYTTVAMEDQRAGMEKVLRYFLEGLNSAMGNIFTQLKARTEELGAWEKDMIEGIRAMTENLGGTVQELDQAQETARAITERMSAYTGAVEELTAAQTKVIERMEGFIADSENAREREGAYMEKLTAAIQAAEESAQTSLAVVKSVSEIAAQTRSDSAMSAETVSAAGVKLAAAAESVRAMSDSVTADVSGAAQRLEQAAGELESGLSGAVASSLGVVDDSLEKLTRTLESVNAASGQVMQAFKSLPKSAAFLNADFKATAKVIDTELKLLLTAVSDTQKILNKFNAEFERRVDG